MFQLSIVTLALFETLLDLNCEDVMLKLCLSDLLPCSHIMLSQRSRLRELDPRGAEKFLCLTPECCLPSNPTSFSTSFSSPDSLPAVKSTKATSSPLSPESLYSNYHAYLRDARQKIARCQLACSTWSSNYEDAEDSNNVLPASNIKKINQRINPNLSFGIEKYDLIKLNYRFLTININFFSEISVFPQDDDSEDLSSKDTSDNIASLSEENTIGEIKLERNMSHETISPVQSAFTPEELIKLNSDIAELLAENVGSTNIETVSLTVDEKYLLNDEDPNTMNSLQLSIGESSGYESFAFKGSSDSTPRNDEDEDETSKEQLLAREEREKINSKPFPLIKQSKFDKELDILSEVIEGPVNFKRL